MMKSSASNKEKRMHDCTISYTDDGPLFSVRLKGELVTEGSDVGHVWQVCDGQSADSASVATARGLRMFGLNHPKLIECLVVRVLATIA